MGAALRAHVLHELPGRVRLHLPAWEVAAQPQVERYFRRLPGVRHVQANPVTGNILVQFGSAETDTTLILEAASRFRAAPRDGRGVGFARDGPGRTSDGAGDASQPPSDSPQVVAQRSRQRDLQHGQRYSRARIAVRGFDRDPRLAPLVVERLEQHASVRARANPLTGRVLVEFAEDAVTLAELTATVAAVERAPLPDEERPAYPLDPGPLAQSVTRLAAAVIGLTIIAVRQARGDARLGAPARIVALYSIAQGMPGLRRALGLVVGRNAAELLLALPYIALKTLVGNPLGLAIEMGASVRLLTEEQSRRAVWRRFEEGLDATARALPGDVLRVESGERAPHVAKVVEGSGTATGADGLPRAVGPGDSIAAGERLVGGPFLLDLEAEPAFTPAPRPEAASPTLIDRYLEITPPAALAAASAAGTASRSVDRALGTMLLVNPRPALVGLRMANLGAAARALRAGVVVVGTRPDRAVRRPDVLLLASPRLLTDGTELVDAWSAYHALERDAVVVLAASVATAAGAPWGNVLQMKDAPAARDGSFRRGVAQASLDGQRYALRAARPTDRLPAPLRRRHAGEQILVLRRVGERRPLGALVLRPRLAAGVAELVSACAETTSHVAVLCRGDPTACRRVAERAGVELITSADDDEDNKDVDVVRGMQRGGLRVAFASDSACAGAAFAACDLAIGVADRRQQFAARADLIVFDVRGIAAVVDSARWHAAAERDAVALSSLSNVAGGVLALRAVVPLLRAGRVVELATLATLGAVWMRLRGGERPQSALAVAADPRPERWGRRSREDALRLLDASEDGLTIAQVATRRRTLAASAPARRTFLTAIVGQLDSPLTVLWGCGAILSLILGAGADAILVAGTLGINVLVGAWQERRTERVADALKQLERAARARVLRDRRQVVVAASELVPGDVLLLASGDRIPADARMLGASGLEVDEAALTGEPFPVVKLKAGGSERQHVVLEGSHVTVGSGRAVIVAVGAGTRLGATAAALDLEDQRRNVLGARLAALLRQSFPVAAAGGAIIAGIGLLRGAPLLAQLTLGTSVVLAAVPEGLPLLTGLGQAATARRLAHEHGIVRRLAAVETLGRVDIACVDKTGTMTRGQLAVRLVASLSHEAVLTGPADSAGSAPSATAPAGAPFPDESLRDILRAAALASPHPDVWNVASHPTDVAVIRGAERAGLGEAIRATRERESPFDPTRAFHAATVDGYVYVKGALEVLLDRCVTVRRDGVDRPLEDATREDVVALGHRLAERGLRVLLVAAGSGGESPDDPRDLTALGFVALSDPLREDVPAVVQRCHEAGVRVMMLTGDHPVTAQAIAREAGLLNGSGGLLTGTEMAELDDDALSARLESATVIARATPLDKLRIVESFQRRGHVVAMTGDGVNDAPALRLADVGVAMGKGGTEVARQAADIVLLDDDFATLVTALVEGRAFWRSTRRALGILLGGNLGELGLMLGASAFGEAAPLSVRQILAVNLVTDLLPAIVLAVQGPPKRRLAELSREGAASLDAPLRRTIGCRMVATALPSLATYLLTGGAGSGEAQSAAFAAVVTTQLAQTLVSGTSDRRIAPPVAAAVGASAALVIGGFALPGVRSLVGLTPLSSLGWALVTGSTLASPLLHRLLAAGAPIGVPPHGPHEAPRLTPAAVHG